MIWAIGVETLRMAKAPSVQPSAYTVLGFIVADIVTELAVLKAKGVEFERFGLPGQTADGIWSAPGGSQVAWFRDPDGNLLSLTQV